MPDSGAKQYWPHTKPLLEVLFLEFAFLPSASSLPGFQFRAIPRMKDGCGIGPLGLAWGSRIALFSLLSGLFIWVFPNHWIDRGIRSGRGGKQDPCKIPHVGKRSHFPGVGRNRRGAEGMGIRPAPTSHRSLGLRAERGELPVSLRKAALKYSGAPKPLRSAISAMLRPVWESSCSALRSRSCVT